MLQFSDLLTRVFRMKGSKIFMPMTTFGFVVLFTVCGEVNLMKSSSIFLRFPRARATFSRWSPMRRSRHHWRWTRDRSAFLRSRFVTLTEMCSHRSRRRSMSDHQCLLLLSLWMRLPFRFHHLWLIMKNPPVTPWVDIDILVVSSPTILMVVF